MNNSTKRRGSASTPEARMRKYKELERFYEAASLARELAAAARKAGDILGTVYLSNEEKAALKSQSFDALNKPGIALFPVYGMNDNSRLLAVKVCPADEEKDALPVPKGIGIAVQQAMDALFVKLANDTRVAPASRPLCAILDYSFDDLRFSFTTPSGKPVSKESFQKESFLLALAVAIVSYLLNRSVPSGTVFTGVINRSGILEVPGSVSEKHRFLKAEREKPFRLYAYMTNSIEGVEKVSSLEGLLWTLFRAAAVNPEEVKIEKKFYVSSRRVVKTADRKETMMITFHYIEKLDTSYARKIYAFFKSVFPALISEQGIILDNLRISYLAPMLMTFLRPNAINNFVSIRNWSLKDEETKVSEAVVVCAAEKGKPTRKEGECFSFSLDTSPQ